jgi:AraC-like DNA-binding protein
MQVSSYAPSVPTTPVMQVTVLKPANNDLGKFIRYFYFLKSSSPGFKQSYVTFPQLTTPLSLLTRVRTRLDADRRRARVWYDPKSRPHAEVDGIFSKPMLVCYTGLIDEVTVVFEPLGLNQFLRSSYSEAAMGPASRRFNPYGAVFDRLLSRIFASGNMHERRNLLEEFFLTQYQPFRNEVLSHSLARVIKEEETSVAQIARSAGVSHKTLTRMFQRHLGASPMVIRKIARFRRSLELMFEKRSPHTSTEVALMSDYYDQSQFIKQYRQLTGDSPTRLQQAVSNICGEKIFWRML